MPQRTAIERGYLLDLTSGARLFFQHMPVSLTETKTANYTDTEILGRSEPIRAFSGNSARAISLELRFSSSAFEGDNGTALELLDKLRLARSFVYPTYTEITLAPPKILFAVGQWLKMTCLVKDYSIAYEAPWTELGTEPMLATVNLSLEEANDNPFGRADILSSQDLAVTR